MVDLRNMLWNTFGAATVKRLVDGAKTLAMLWTAAWREGGGETIDAAEIQPQPESALQKLYNTDSFDPSVWLKDWRTLPHL
jgi:hypothetical protein